MAEREFEEKRRQEPYYSWSSGMAMGPGPGAIPPGYSRWAINVVESRGDLRNRFGRQRVGDRLPGGSATCYWLGQLRLRGTSGSVARSYLRINKHDLFELTGQPDPTGVWLNKGSVALGDRLVCGVQWLNQVWFGDGAETAVWDGSAVQPWGYTAGTAPTHVAEVGAGGNLFNGKSYYFGYTFYSPSTTEETTVSTPLIRTMVTAGNVLLETAEIPAQNVPARFTEVRLYRSYYDQTIMRRETTGVAYTGAATTVTFGTLADADLGAIAPYANTPPPALERFLLFENRFFGWTRNSSTLLWSDTNKPWAWPQDTNQAPVNLDDGDELRGAFVMHGTLYIQKRRSTFAVNPDPVFTYAVTQLPSDVGCLSHFSICIIGNYAYGYDERGFWRFNGAQFNRLSDFNMDFFLHARRHDQALDAYAVYDARPDRPYYRCILDGPDPRDVTVTRRWWVNLFEPTTAVSLIQNWDAKVVTTVESDHADPVTERLIVVPEVWSGDEQGAVYRHFEDKDFNVLYTDDDPDAVPQPIPFDWRSADIAIGSNDKDPVPPYEHKAWHQLFIEVGQSEGPTPTVRATSYLDGVDDRYYDVVGYQGGKITEAVRWNVGGTPMRRAGFRLSGSGSFDARIEGVVFEYTPLGVRLKGVP